MTSRDCEKHVQTSITPPKFINSEVMLSDTNLRWLVLFSVTVSFHAIVRGDWNFFKCFETDKRCPNQNVSFYLYTRETQKNPTQLDMFNPDTVMNANFVRGRPLIILIHGYTGHRDYAPNPTIRPAYFAYDEFNIISVDYNPLALEPCYLQAVRNLPTVANCTAQLLDFIIGNNIVPLEDIHVVGFSLGGQTSGMIANYLKSGRLKRITGLDPAKPLFVFAPNDRKLDQADAEFVQVIHTDVFQRGILHPSGHTDFYVNGGVEQPGCNATAMMTTGECNHNRAPEYYAESIATEVGFYGYRCAHWYLYMLGVCRGGGPDQQVAIMGAHTPDTTRGLYFLNVNMMPPYARGRNYTLRDELAAISSNIRN
uniref:Lipase domain-containing protein n=1 Tax=Anopheles atroparvus TaxID=41427 RepID=A0AAG5DWE9_ANOAO